MLYKISTKQKWALILILLITPVGFYTKFYSGPAASWVNDSLGGVFYEIFWCLLVSLFLVNSRAWVIATSVFMVTCLLEVLQLWHPEFLEIISDSGGHLYACKATVEMFGFSMNDFVSQVDDIITVGEFYEMSAGSQIIFT